MEVASLNVVARCRAWQSARSTGTIKAQLAGPCLMAKCRLASSTDVAVRMDFTYDGQHLVTSGEDTTG